MIEEVLKKHGVHPNTEMDQHFLNSTKIIEKEVKEAKIQSSNTVLEIGGGIGNLTEKLVEKAGKVIVIEKDSKLVEILRKKFRDQEKVKIIEGDFLTVKENIPKYDICVSNPPYNLSSEIIRELGDKQVRSVLLLQKDFVEKLVAEPGSKKYCLFTTITNYYFLPVFLKKVSKNLFTPSPEVGSALVKLFPRKKKYGVSLQDYEKTAKALFTHRRKKVRNAVVDSRHILGKDKDELKDLRDKIPYSNKRVVNLDPRKIAEVSKFLEENL